MLKSFAMESLVRLACAWEVYARKAGNVCPGREFADLHVDDFLRSADAISPILGRAVGAPLGVTIRRAVEATHGVVGTNTNLGIVLLLAPMAAVPLGESLPDGLRRILRATTRTDASEVYAAIRLANPGGLGVAPSQDIHSEPTQTLRDVMTLARERDLIAAQYADDFALILGEMLPAFTRALQYWGNIERAIVTLQIQSMANWPDSLIARKLGLDAAVEVQRRACDLLSRDPHFETRSFLEFDAWLRACGHARNPGTTADLIAATLFAALREGIVSSDSTFNWPNHPFGDGHSRGPALAATNAMC